MSIIEEKINKNTGILKVSVKIKDYKDKVAESIKGYRKKVSLPGFRSGMVPVSLIKKKYGLSIKIDEINKLLSEKVNKFLKENNPSIMGYPLPKKADIDWAKEDDYIFEYELGYRPEFNITLPKKDKVLYYSIKPDDKQVKDAVDNLRKQHGENTFPNDVKINDILYIKLDEIQRKGESKKLVSHSSSLLVDDLLVSGLKTKLLKSKKDDTLMVNIKEVFKNETELSSLLNIKKEEIEHLNNEFSLKIDSIKRVSPAKLNEDFFKKSFPEETIKTKKEFNLAIEKKFSEMYEKQSENKYFNDVVDFVIDSSKIDLPNDFLKRWIVANSDGKKKNEDVEKEYNLYQKSFCWELIKDKIILEQNIDLTEETVFSKAKEIFKLQLLQYGMKKEDVELENMTKNLIQNQEERRRIEEQIVTDEMIKYFKKNIKAKNKEVSIDEFSKLVTKN